LGTGLEPNVESARSTFRAGSAILASRWFEVARDPKGEKYDEA
jgi:hypothetical protein